MAAELRKLFPSLGGDGPPTFAPLPTGHPGVPIVASQSASSPTPTTTTTTTAARAKVAPASIETFQLLTNPLTLSDEYAEDLASMQSSKPEYARRLVAADSKYACYATRKGSVRIVHRETVRFTKVKAKGERVKTLEVQTLFPSLKSFVLVTDVADHVTVWSIEVDEADLDGNDVRARRVFSKKVEGVRTVRLDQSNEDVLRVVCGSFVGTMSLKEYARDSEAATFRKTHTSEKDLNGVEISSGAHSGSTTVVATRLNELVSLPSGRKVQFDDGFEADSVEFLDDGATVLVCDASRTSFRIFNAADGDLTHVQGVRLTDERNETLRMCAVSTCSPNLILVGDVDAARLVVFHVSPDTHVSTVLGQFETRSPIYSFSSPGVSLDFVEDLVSNASLPEGMEETLRIYALEEKFVKIYTLTQEKLSLAKSRQSKISSSSFGSQLSFTGNQKPPYFSAESRSSSVLSTVSPMNSPVITASTSLADAQAGREQHALRGDSFDVAALTHAAASRGTDKRGIPLPPHTTPQNETRRLGDADSAFGEDAPQGAVRVIHATMLPPTVTTSSSRSSTRSNSKAEDELYTSSQVEEEERTAVERRRSKTHALSPRSMRKKSEPVTVDQLDEALESFYARISAGGQGPAPMFRSNSFNSASTSGGAGDVTSPDDAESSPYAAGGAVASVGRDRELEDLRFAVEALSRTVAASMSSHREREERDAALADSVVERVRLEVAGVVRHTVQQAIAQTVHDAVSQAVRREFQEAAMGHQQELFRAMNGTFQNHFQHHLVPAFEVGCRAMVGQMEKHFLERVVPSLESSVARRLAATTTTAAAPSSSKKVAKQPKSSSTSVEKVARTPKETIAAQIKGNRFDQAIKTSLRCKDQDTLLWDLEAVGDPGRVFGDDKKVAQIDLLSTLEQVSFGLAAYDKDGAKNDDDEALDRRLAWLQAGALRLDVGDKSVLKHGPAVLGVVADRVEKLEVVDPTRKETLGLTANILRSHLSSLPSGAPAPQ